MDLRNGLLPQLRPPGRESDRVLPLDHKGDEEDEEGHKHRKDLHDEPSVVGDSVEVLQKLGLRNTKTIRKQIRWRKIQHRFRLSGA